MRRADAELRAELVQEGALFGGYSERMAAVHQAHNARLREILEEYGWPGRRLVGEDGAAAAWLLLQHAVLDPDLMRTALVRVEQATFTGDCEAKHLALLIDRIRTLEGRLQLYGTQHDWDATGQLSPLPIEAPEGVDERRRRMGLESLAENTSRLRAQAVAEGEHPPTDYHERQRDIERWAQSVGWR